MRCARGKGQRMARPKVPGRSSGSGAARSQSLRWPGTPQFPQLLEDASDRVLQVPVGTLFDAIVTRAYEPDGDCPHDMAPLDFGFKGLAGVRPHEAQL